MKTNHNEEKSVKHLKETIETLKRQNLKLKIENRNLLSLKDIITKLQEEKMDLSRKLMEMEGEVVLYKDTNDINDEMLYNPRKGSRFSTISQKESFHKIPSSSSKETKKETMKITKENFCILSKYNTSEEIDLLKNELIKKDKIIEDFKFNKKMNISDIFSRNFQLRKNSDTKEINDSMFDENESQFNLETNIYKEIENILEEKRNFVIKTLTIENFCFDILKNKENAINKKIEFNTNNIEQILELIKQRKKKVEITKKYLEEKIS